MPSSPVPDASPALAAATRAWQLLQSLPGRRDESLAVLDGFFGDALASRGSPLAIPMTVRGAGEPLSLDRDGLGRGLPRASARICLLVHGLMGTEAVWRYRDDPEVTFGSLLARDRGVTPVYLRYNTGLHISTNARELSRLLADLVAAWPVRVSEITLIGHSMGGLVVRGACHYAQVRKPIVAGFRRSWPSKVRRVVLLGVPNTGASLEVLVNLTSSVLWALPNPVTRLVGLGLDRRSDGIKDLRFGYILDDDWYERDPSVRQRPPLRRVRPVRRAEYLVVAGSLTTHTEHPITSILGDALVTPSSARGQVSDSAGPSMLPHATCRVMPRVSHLALASDPAVYHEILNWWSEP